MNEAKVRKALPFERDTEVESRIRAWCKRFKHEAKKVLVFNDDRVLDLTLLALLTESHVIYDSVPGAGKTLLCDTIAAVLDIKHNKKQFTADMLPKDLLGYVDLDQVGPDGKPLVVRGIIDCNLFLADELNRASGRVKSSMLGPLEERRYSLDYHDGPLYLPRPFYTFATINPIETNKDVDPLGQAEVNRYGLLIEMDMPTEEKLGIIMARDPVKNLKRVEKVAGATELLEAIAYIRRMAHTSGVDGKDITEYSIFDYVKRLGYATHFAPDNFSGVESIKGSTPRVVTSFWRLLNAYKILSGKDFLVPGDVHALIYPAWQHRVIAEDKEEARAIIGKVLRHVSPVPKVA